MLLYAAVGYSTGLRGNALTFQAAVMLAERVLQAAPFEPFVPPGGLGTKSR